MPLLTPIGLDPAHPFPRVFNKSLNFAVELEGRDAFGRDSRAAIVQAPRVLPRVIRLPKGVAHGPNDFIFLTSILHAHVGELFAGHERARLLPVPRDAQLRPLRRGGGGEGPAQGAAGRIAAAPLRRRRAPRSRRQHVGGDDALPALAVRAGGRRPLRRRRPGEPGAPHEHPRAGESPRPRVRAVHAGPAQGARQGARPLRGDPQGRRPAAPAVPVVRAGDRVHPPGGERPAGRRDQADRVPHRHRLGDHADAHRRGARRQGSHRGGGADGALRRGGQHQLGGAPGGSRRARGLRRGRPQDPRQDGARGAARGRQAGALRAPGHRQLPPAHRALLHRLRPAHLQRGRSAPT